MSPPVLGLALDIDETLSQTNLAWFQRLIQLFGNDPRDPARSERSIMAEFHLAQDVPWWRDNTAAMAWMDAQRTSPEAQMGLPVIGGAVEGVRILLELGQRERLDIVCYLTVRPASVIEPYTIKWLNENGFPPRPVVAKPDEPAVPFSKGNEWKAGCLRLLYGVGVHGIVDDNPKLPRCMKEGRIFLEGEGEKIVATSESDSNSDSPSRNLSQHPYPGRVFLYSRDKTEPEYDIACACVDWTTVVVKVKQWAEEGSTGI